MKVEYGAWTDPGMKRDRNEDSFFIDAFNGLFAVFDGMGGGHSGELAGQVCTEALVEFGNPTFPKQSPFIEPLLVQSLKHANKAILEVQKPGAKFQHAGCAATVAAIQIEDNSVTIAHAGDCRVYRLSRGQLSRCTRDHTLLDDPAFIALNLPPEQLKTIPMNVVVRALGMKADVDLTSSLLIAESGDVFLLCSDGIHEMLTDEQIEFGLKDQFRLNANDLEEVARTLIRQANAMGGNDNSAVVLVRIT